MSGKKTLEIGEKIVIPTLGLIISLLTAGIASYVAVKQNEIAIEQNDIQDKVAQIQATQFDRELEQKYIEIFYTEIASGDERQQQLALSLLGEIEPSLALKLSRWAQTSGRLNPETEQKARDIELRLLIDISSPDRSTRRAATDILKNQYAESESAVTGILDLFSSSKIDSLSAAGRINALFFLANTKTSAWTPDLTQEADKVVKSLEKRHQSGVAIIGSQTRQYLEEFKRHLSKVKAEISG